MGWADHTDNRSLSALVFCRRPYSAKVLYFCLAVFIVKEFLAPCERFFHQNTVPLLNLNKLCSYVAQTLTMNLQTTSPPRMERRDR